MKFNSLILAAVILTICGCNSHSNKADGGGGGNGGSANGTHYFKSESGQHSELFPLVGIQEFDNQITTYSFWRKCDDPTNSIEAFSSVTNKPIKDTLYGPEIDAPLCDMSSKYVYSQGQLTATGTYDTNSAFEVKFQEITKEEFIQILQSTSLGLKTKYHATSTPFFDKNRYDDICTDLLGSTCTNYL